MPVAVIEAVPTGLVVVQVRVTLQLLAPDAIVQVVEVGEMVPVEDATAPLVVAPALVD